MSSLHIRTPLIKSSKLGKLCDKEVFLKMECYQPVGSFKIRGMGLLAQTMVREGTTRLFTSSGGNAGYAIAYAGNRLGADVTVVVPEATNEEVCEAIAAERAQIKRFGKDWNDAHEEAVAMAREFSGGYLHPFDDPVAWEGHSTVVDELVEQSPKPDAIVLSVGGGGLFCGVMLGLQKYPEWQDVPVVAVETNGADSLHSSVKAGELITLNEITSLAVTLGARQVAPQAFKWAMTEQVTPLTVTDYEAVRACQQFADDHRVFVEPACGAALSLVYRNHPSLETARSILVIVCGGIGVDQERLRIWEKRTRTDSE